MSNLSFVLWMLFFPITYTVSNWISIKTRNDADTHTEQLRITASVIIAAIYIVVAILLYEKNGDVK